MGEKGGGTPGSQPAIGTPEACHIDTENIELAQPSAWVYLTEVVHNVLQGPHATGSPEPSW